MCFLLLFLFLVSDLLIVDCTKISFFLIDTSEYPGSHSLFCYSPDAEIPSKVQKIFDEAAEEAPRTIGDTIGKMMASLSRIVGSVPTHYETLTDDEDAQSSVADYDVYDEYDDIGSAPIEPNSIKAKLQE
jgi:ubiquitin-conjugating enzyme E2 Q